MMTLRTISKISSLLFLLSFALSAQSHENDAESEFGVVNFDISCYPDTQLVFNRAVALLHNMMYLQAEQMFNEALTAESDCAMLHWGVAMTNFHPLWPGGQNPQELERGAAAVARALDIGSETARENAYIKAVSAIYEQDIPYRKRLENWNKLQQQVYESHPDDVDAGSLFALSLLAVTPKADKTLANQKQAGLLLEDLRASYPEHPAGFHYLIHAYDNPLLATKAESVARAYDKIAPSVPHALHMPSHIFVRMGLWEETIFWNNRSAQTALDNANGDPVQSHYAHAIDYKVYAHLQRGEHKMAADDIQTATAVPNQQSSFASAYGLAASAARLPLETDDWAAAMDLTLRENTSIDWEKFPAAVAITHFAKGIGAARSGNFESAEKTVIELSALHDQLLKDGPAYWATLAESQVKAVSGWLAFAQEDKSNAELLMQAAADIEDSVDKSPVTPGAVLPARELYGDMLSELGKHSEALTAYEKALRIGPNRRRSMLGAMHAAEAINDKEKAQVYEKAVNDLSAGNNWIENSVITVDAE